MSQDEGTVLILAPTGRDGEGVSLLLGKAGIVSRAYLDFEKLSADFDERAGVVLIAEEALTGNSLSLLVKQLENQPVWSDLPVILLTRAATGKLSPRSVSIQLSTVLGNIMFLERPLHGLTLISAVRSALNARRRQFQGRDYLLERERVSEALRQSEAAARVYAEKLERSNKELEQFAAIASHDLQAPLRKIELFSDMLQKANAGTLSEESQDYIDRMLKATRRMQQLISDLLDLARVTRQGKPFLPFPLEPTIQEALEDLTEIRRDTQAIIEVAVAADICLLGDQGQIQQVFQNLIQNALKYHRAGVTPRVRVFAEVAGDICRIEVSDNGIGFKEEHSERIFEVFQRLHGSQEYPGTGIGLSIVRKIIERHLGVITVSSTPGTGSAFTIQLPCFMNQSEPEPLIEASS